MPSNTLHQEAGKRLLETLALKARAPNPECWGSITTAAEKEPALLGPTRELYLRGMLLWKQSAHAVARACCHRIRRFLICRTANQFARRSVSLMTLRVSRSQGRCLHLPRPQRLLHSCVFELLLRSACLPSSVKNRSKR